MLTLAVLIQNQTYLARITQINSILNAVIEINPDVRDIARKADEQRSHGRVLGSVLTEDYKSPCLTKSSALHGIPFLVKDMFCTLDKMRTAGEPIFKAHSKC